PGEAVFKKRSTASTDAVIRFLMLLLASKTNPTDTGPSSKAKLEICCSTLSSKIRKRSRERSRTGRSAESTALTGTSTTETSNRKLGRLLDTGRFGARRGVIVTCDCPKSRTPLQNVSSKLRIFCPGDNCRHSV